jgi:hypothetical protein
VSTIIRSNKKYASTKYVGQQNIGANKFLASTKLYSSPVKASSYCFGLAKSEVADSSLPLLAFSSEDDVSSLCSN